MQRLASVVVVDNASDDDSATAASAQPGVTVIVNDANVGFGTACNIGATATPAGVDLLFLNPDAAIDADDLVRLTEKLRHDPACALVAPRLFRDGQPIPSSGDDATVASELRRFAPKLVARVLPERRHSATAAPSGPVSYVEGACMLVRRQAFDEVGGFDPSFFLFFEELDLATRLRAAGWNVQLVGDARAEHLVAASRASLPDNARAALVDGTVRYLAKRHGVGSARRFVRLAKPLWWLRQRRGQLTPQERAGYLSAAHAALATVSRGRGSAG